MNHLAIPRLRRWLSALCVVVLASASLGAPAGTHVAWDFTLPTLDGDRFVQASKLSGPVLVNFWGRDCAPCVAELPLLQAFAQANPGWTVLLVCTDPAQDARVYLQKHHITLSALKSGANVTSLMSAAGNRHGSLPFTVVLREGRICQTHLGGLTTADLQTLRMACTSSDVPR